MFVIIVISGADLLLTVVKTIRGYTRQSILTILITFIFFIKMGCDIHSYAEVKKNWKRKKVWDHFFITSKWEREYKKKDKHDIVFNCRNYALFWFLADVRNYSMCTPLWETKWLPKDVSKEVLKKSEYRDDDWHSRSYYTLEELLKFDYDTTFRDRRIARNGNFTALAEEWEWEVITYREHLWEWYFRVLKELWELGDPKDVRVVFWFDS